MAIDPVVFLAEEIRGLERNLRAECKRNEACYDRNRMEAINVMVGRIRALYGELLETVPTSVLGAGELIRIAASRLPFAHARYATHLHQIAERLEAGRRLPGDLIWVRALAEAMAATPGHDSKTAALLALAVKGMARPVVVWRSAGPLPPPVTSMRELSGGPPGMAMPFVPERF